MIFLFLRNLSATLIPSLALPMSIVGTFAVMYLLGYSLDNLSLMALTLSVGLRRGRRHRHAREHRPPHGDGEGAAAGGARRLAGDRLHHRLDDPVAGRGVHPGALHGRHRRPAAPRVRGHDRRRDPGLRARLADPHADAVQPLPAAAGGGAARPRLRGLGAGLRRHARGLRLEPHEGPAAPAGHDPRVSVVLLAATAYLFVVIPKGFIPNEDTGQIFAFTEAAQGISFEAMVEHQSAMAEIVGKDPNVESLMSSVGASGSNVSGNSGRIFIRLKPRAERALSADEIIQELRPKLAGVPGIRVVPADPAPDPDRRAAHQEPVPVHAAGARTPASSTGWRPAARGEAARPARAAGRDERPADREPAGERRDRPRQGRRARGHRGADRERALQRLRRAAGLDDLRAEQRSTR